MDHPQREHAEPKSSAGARPPVRDRRNFPRRTEELRAPVAADPIEAQPESEPARPPGEIEGVRLVIPPLRVVAVVQEIRFQAGDEAHAGGIAPERGPVVLEGKRFRWRDGPLGELREGGQRRQPDRYGTGHQGTHRPSSTSAAGWTSLPA